MAEELKVNLTGKAAGGSCVQGERKKVGKTTLVFLGAMGFWHLQKILLHRNRCVEGKKIMT